MIYYYSATGNTRFAAKYLAEKLNTTAYDLLSVELPDTLEDDGEPIGIMFPIYCWGIPPVVNEFVGKLAPKLGGKRYVWGVCTCGDEAGLAMREFDKLVEQGRGRGADAIYSVIMPNTYVMLPGFDTDKPEEAERKLKNAPERLDEIVKTIESKTTPVYYVTEGAMPGLRSSIFPIFKKWGVKTKWWHVSDKCIGCGKCAAICPAKNITMKDKHPEWGENCFSCCACFHCCPEKAISYAKFTRKKSQYLCPL